VYVEKGRARILSAKEAKLWLQINREMEVANVVKRAGIAAEDLINRTAEEFVELNNALLNDRDVWGERIELALLEKNHRGFQICYMSLEKGQLVKKQFSSRLYLSCKSECMGNIFGDFSVVEIVKKNF